MWFPSIGQEKAVMCPRAEAAVVKEGKILSATPIQEVQVPINDLEGMCQDCC